jgi:hypothetical protein
MPRRTNPADPRPTGRTRAPRPPGGRPPAGRCRPRTPPAAPGWRRRPRSPEGRPRTAQGDHLDRPERGHRAGAHDPVDAGRDALEEWHHPHRSQRAARKAAASAASCSSRTQRRQKAPPPLRPPRPVDPPPGDLRQLVEHRAEDQRLALRVPPVKGVHDLVGHLPQEPHGRPDLGHDVGRAHLDHPPLRLVGPGHLPGPDPRGQEEGPLRAKLPQPPAHPVSAANGRPVVHTPPDPGGGPE